VQVDSENSSPPEQVHPKEDPMQFGAFKQLPSNQVVKFVSISMSHVSKPATNPSPQIV